MRTPDSLLTCLARHFVLGTVAGWTLLAICLFENISNLGYAVLAGGFWALAALVASFGLAGGSLGVCATLLGQWQARARMGVAQLQLARVRTPRRRG